VATNEVRCAQNDDAIFRLLSCYVLVTTTEVITRIGNYNRSYYKIPLR